MYGRVLGALTQVSGVDVYAADHWLGDGFLRAGDIGGRPPRVETNPIQIHPWAGWMQETGATDEAEEIIRRFDYAIDRDGFVAVVSLDNGSSETLPDLFAHAANAIVVGREDGDHSRGTTRYEGLGRPCPDLVGPLPSRITDAKLWPSILSCLLAWALQ